MSLEVEYIDTLESVNENQWNYVVENSALGRVYHRYGWLRAIEAGTPYEPKHLVVSKKNNPIGIFPNFVTDNGTIPVRHLTSSEVSPGGPITITDEKAAMQSLLDPVPDLCDGRIVSNWIQTYGPEYSRYHRLFEQNGYTQKLGYCDFTLDISRSWEDILAGMDGSRRNAIRRAHDNEVEILDKEITERTMSAFFDGFSSVMERVGAQTIPREFFLELCAFSERMKLFAVRADGKERGALLYTLDDEQSTIHCEFSAVTEEHFEYNSTELIHEHAIQWAIERGYDTYNFGGTEPDFRDGLFRFKEKFGARPIPALAWERGCSTIRWPAFRLGRTLYQKFLAS